MRCWRLLCVVTAFLAGVSLSTPADDSGLWNNQSYTIASTIRGVSLGGWLVLEPWITPSLFDLVLNKTNATVVDEYTLCTQLGPEAEPLLRSHWDTFITKADIREISAMGFNLVRVPIGYWAVQKQRDDPYIGGQLMYLEKVFEWSREYGLQVQIDVHGMPGSQNGFDNSGHSVPTPLWLKDNASFDVSINVLQYLFGKYSGPKYQGVLHSIEVVNEPFGPLLGRSKIEDFYDIAESMSKKYDVPIFIHDAFFGVGSWGGFQETSTSQVTIDHHFYSIFSQAQIEWETTKHYENTVGLGNILAQTRHSKVVGEFSGALTDCVRYLNGVGSGHRYDGTFENTAPIGTCFQHEDITKWPQDKIINTLKFIYLQIQVYDNTCSGWIFWTYKTESAWEWDYSKLVAIGLLPPTVEEIVRNKRILKGIYL